MQLQVTPIRRMPLAIPVLDYLCPDNLVPDAVPGSLINIDLRGKREFGLIVSRNTSAEVARGKLKPISGLTAPHPLLPVELVEFVSEFSEFYRAPASFIYKSSLFAMQKSKIAKLHSDLRALPVRSKISGSEKPLLQVFNNAEERENILLKISRQSGQRFFLTPDARAAADMASLLKRSGVTDFHIVTGEISVKNYFDSWLYVRNNPDAVVIGTRKAIFLPWISLTGIVMDDEGSFDYKSWDMAPRYQARDAILMLSKYTGAQLTFTSAAPSVETWYFANHGVYRTGGKLEPIKSPSPIFINSSEEGRFEDNSCLAREIIGQVENTEGNVFIAAAKRGTASGVVCRDCGHLFRCEKCARPFTYFAGTNKLACNFCKIDFALPELCPKCARANYRLLSPGTDGIARELKKRLNKNKNIVVLGDDSPPLTLTEPNGVGNVYIGTSNSLGLIAAEKIKMVVLADPDTALSLPEYKTAEELWQKIRRTQINLPSEGVFYIQTRLPDHHAYQGVYNPDYFYTKEIADRKAFDYPPARYLIRLYYGGVSASEAEAEAARLFDDLRRLTGVKTDVIISNPLPASPPYYRERYWRVILLKIDYRTYKQTAKSLLRIVPEAWKVDPNPNNILAIT